MMPDHVPVTESDLRRFKLLQAHGLANRGNSMQDRVTAPEIKRNKKEAKALRRLMAAHHLSEEQVRGHEVLKLDLHAARMSKGSKSSVARLVRRVFKSVTATHGLAAEHPVVRESFFTLWSQQYGRYCCGITLSAQEAWAMLRGEPSTT